MSHEHKSIFIFPPSFNPLRRGGFTSSATASKTAWRLPRSLRTWRLSYHRWRRRLPSRCLRLPLSEEFLFPKNGVSRRPITRSLRSYAPLERNFLFDEHAAFRTAGFRKAAADGCSTDCHSQAGSDWSKVLKNSTVSSRSLMLQPSLADVSKLAPLPQLRQACEILFGREQACQKLREFFVYKNTVAYKPDEGRSRLCRDRVALRTTLAFIHRLSLEPIIVLLP
jgi:hypothetical protein